MRCEQARAQLFEYADDSLPDAQRAAIAEHLEGCAGCRADYEGIVDLTLKAAVWHDVPAPRWQPPRVGTGVSLAAFQQWFPTLASAAALILVAGIYLRGPAQAPGAATAPPGLTAQLPAEVSAPMAGAAVPARASIDALMSSNRLERQQELQALVQLLRAEMDRRSEETEESLRYVIAHQIQGQREIDDLYQYIRKVSAAGSLPSGQQPEEQM